MCRLDEAPAPERKAGGTAPPSSFWKACTASRLTFIELKLGQQYSLSLSLSLARSAENRCTALLHCETRGLGQDLAEVIVVHCAILTWNLVMDPLKGIVVCKGFFSLHVSLAACRRTNCGMISCCMKSSTASSLALSPPRSRLRGPLIKGPRA